MCLLMISIYSVMSNDDFIIIIIIILLNCPSKILIQTYRFFVYLSGVVDQSFTSNFRVTMMSHENYWCNIGCLFLYYYDSYSPFHLIYFTSISRTFFKFNCVCETFFISVIEYTNLFVRGNGSFKVRIHIWDTFTYEYTCFINVLKVSLK